MRYALLIYNDSRVADARPEEDLRRVTTRINEVLERPQVTGWVRLQAVESATTVRHGGGRTLLTDGPFVESKDFLGGLIIVEAESLDGALAVAGELQEIRGGGAIEVRPIRDEAPAGA
jgi:hypothetical protein